MIEKDFKTNPFLYNPNQKQGLPDFGNNGLSLLGNVSRGVSVGNNQDLVVNSNLNLQLSGRLGEDVDVTGVISDENNPIQPEGNTQQLQDFDRVYIELRKDSSTLTVGDFLMQRPHNSYFMNYYKKSRGAQFSSVIYTRDSNRFSLSGEGAVSRGRFSRNTISGQEGNQGPYRLQGTNGEIFIVIISGTEKVYLDGELLTRGEQNDYVIDYNSGEVTFMPKRIITQYSRIVVEFQYSDRNYARSVFRLGGEYEVGKVNMRFNYFTEQDNKNQPFQQDLDDTARRILADVGDSLQLAVLPSIQGLESFDAERIMYRKIDSLGFQDVFVYTDNPQSDSNFFILNFSFVGQGNGNYIPVNSNANGRVFQWVQPAGGIPQGSYEPVIVLISPKKQQMYTFGIDYKLYKNTLITAELVGTDNDINTFSSKDGADDQGLGYRFGLNSIKTLDSGNAAPLTLTTKLNYEFVDANFRYIERYRPVEFDRIWNRQLINPDAQKAFTGESIANADLTLFKKDKVSLNYNLGTYDRQNGFFGLRNYLDGTVYWKGFRVNGGAELLSTDLPSSPNTSAAKAEFNNQKIDVARLFPFITLGARYEIEESKFLTDTNSVLLSNSYGYNIYKVYIDNPVNANLLYHADYTLREDRLPALSGEGFSNSTDGQSVNTSLQRNGNKGSRLLFNFTYRELDIKDAALTSIAPDKSILGRVEYDIRFLKKIFASNTYYQVGTGQEQRREFSYLEVLPGQGVYAWIDYDSNGIQSLNEFEIAVFQDQAKFIRVYTPSTGFVQSNSTELNQTLNINPQVYFKGKENWTRYIGKFNNLTVLKIDQKILEGEVTDALNPFKENINDTGLLSENSLIRNTVFFNRSDPTFGMDFTYQENRNRNLLVNGIDTRNRLDRELNTRYNLNSSWTINLLLKNGTKSFNSQFFSTRNYNFNYNEVEPEIAYQYKTKLRIALHYSYSEAANDTALGGEKMTNNDLGTEVRFNSLGKGSFNATYNYISIDYNGSANSPVGYEMLQGLQNGINQTWTLAFQQMLKSNVQLTVSYNGRKTETANAVHIGRIQARYLF